MSIGYSSALATGYVELTAVLKAKLLAAGWTVVGATTIYKSAAADARGNYAYVDVTDNGAGVLQLRASSRLNKAGTGLALSMARNVSCSTGTNLWDFFIYDKWFHFYNTKALAYQNDHGTAGLFRPFPHSQFWYNPVWIHSGAAGAERGAWLLHGSTSSLAGRVWYPHGTATYCAPCMSIGSGDTKPNTAPMRHSGGILIQPCNIWNPSGSHAIFGNIYNAVIYGGFYWESSAISVAVKSVFEYGSGNVFMVPTRVNIHQALGMSVAFQVEGM